LAPSRRSSRSQSPISLELVDQAQARFDRALPRLGQPESGEELAAADAEQIGDGARLAMGE
jgi:hypothetical protein